MLERRLSSIG